MYLTFKKITTLAIVIGLTALLSACNSETSGSTSSSGGSSSISSESSSGTRDQFSLVLKQTTQTCADCGVWFESAVLVIDHSSGTYTSSQTGSLGVKQTANDEGSFKADLSSIPSSANISKATLNMRLNAHEGIANSDFTSVIAVYGYIGGELKFIREITARDDIKGKGYSKANPVVPIDFTSYAQGL